MARPAPRRRARRRPSPRIVLRWLALGVTILVGLLYIAPLRSYFETKAALDQRRVEVEGLRRERLRLERRLAASTRPDAILAEARRLGFVKEGERLFIVKGIPACDRQKCWRISDENG